MCNIGCKNQVGYQNLVDNLIFLNMYFKTTIRNTAISIYVLHTSIFILHHDMMQFYAVNGFSDELITFL